MTTGKFIKMGTKLGSTYAETGDAMYDLIDDFYSMNFSMAKSAGAATYVDSNWGGNGYFNAIMGKEITAAMFSTDNIYTALGAKPYQHEGVRIAAELADYGLDSKTKEFVGIGAGTIQDGDIPDSVALPVDEFREPYKDLPFSFDYGLGLQALEHKDDDTSSYRQYVEMMAGNYSDLIDKTLLRPIDKKQPTVTDNNNRVIETSLNGIARCIASGTEADGSTITDDMVTPYGGIKSDFYEFRSGASSHVQNNYDGNVIDLNGGTLSIADMKKLYRVCSINWKDQANPNNKMFAMSNISQDKLSSLMLANNVLLDTVYVERTFNGVKSIPGRDVGMLVNTFQNIPIVQDGNLNFDFTTKRVSDTKMGDVYLLDLTHIWMSMLTPVEMRTADNFAYTRRLQEKNVMNMRAETRIDSFIQHGRIKNIADDL